MRHEERDPSNVDHKHSNPRFSSKSITESNSTNLEKNLIVKMLIWTKKKWNGMEWDGRMEYMLSLLWEMWNRNLKIERER
jgi:hypothetical protein